MNDKFEKWLKAKKNENISDDALQEDDVIGFCYKNSSKAEAACAGPRACPGRSRETCCWCEAMLEAVKPTRLYEVPSFCFIDLHNFHCSKSFLSFRLF